MGGQACVFYGAAEFSRDTDVALLASDDNIASLRAALRELRAKRIALPPFEPEYLHRGHAIHFRSYHPDALNMRIDTMSVMRGVDAFEQLWLRRTTVEEADGIAFDVLALGDLVKAKKTQRSKDWPMIRRLVEADFAAQDSPSESQREFWLLESRTPEMLVQLAQGFREQMTVLADERPLLKHALLTDIRSLESALHEEQMIEVENDKMYWRPLRKELEAMRYSGYSLEENV